MTNWVKWHELVNVLTKYVKNLTDKKTFNRRMLDEEVVVLIRCDAIVLCVVGSCVRLKGPVVDVVINERVL